MPVLPSRVGRRVSVLPAAPLRNHFHIASQQADLRFRKRLLLLPTLETSGGRDLQQLPCSVSDLKELLDSRPQIWEEPDSNNILACCRKEELQAVQEHFQPSQLEVSAFHVNSSFLNDTLLPGTVSEIKSAKMASSTKLDLPMLPSTVLLPAMVSC